MNRLAALALYTALTLLMTWPLPLRLGDAMPIGPDNVYVAWSLAWAAHAVRHLPLSIFEANIFHPVRHALMFSDPNLSSGLLMAPLEALGASPALVLNVFFLASFVLCAWAAHALAASWTGSERSGVAAGLLFGFSPMRFSHVDHVQLYAFWWTPLALLGLDRFLRTGRTRGLALCVIALALQAYASVYLAVFAGLALALEVGLALATGRSAVGGRRLVLGGGLGVAALVVLCLPLVMAGVSTQQTWAATRTVEQCARYSASPFAYLSAAPGNVIWGRWLDHFADPVAPWEKYLFPGIAGVVLAALGANGGRTWTWRYGMVVATVAGILSLGPYLQWGDGREGSWPLPYLLGYHWFLPLRALRAPARWGLLASLGLALAGAAGAARLPRPVLAALLALAVAEAWVRPLPLAGAPPFDPPPAVYRYLASTPGGAIVELPLAPDDREAMRIEAPRLYYSTLHWRPLVNGYSGYTPPPYRALFDLLSKPPSRRTLELLCGWDIRTVVLHLDALGAGERSAWDALGSDPGVRVGFSEGSVRVLELDLAPTAVGRAHAVLAGGGPLAAGRRQPVEITFDGAGPVLGLATEDLGWHRGTAQWRGADGVSRRGWAKYFCPLAIYPEMAVRPLFVRAPDTPGVYRVELAAECFTLSSDVTVAAR